MFRKIRILITTVGIVVGLPLTTFLVVRHIQSTQRTEQNARIMAVEQEANARIAGLRAEGVARTKDSCETGNTFRAKDLATWEFILKLSPPPADPTALARIGRFHAYIVDKDKPRDCVAVAKGTP